MSNRPTRKQLEILRLTVADGGVLEIGGQDGRKVSTRALNNCIESGLLIRSGDWHWTHGVTCGHVGYKLTDTGRAALAEQEVSK